MEKMSGMTLLSVVANRFFLLHVVLLVFLSSATIVIAFAPHSHKSLFTGNNVLPHHKEYITSITAINYRNFELASSFYGDFENFDDEDEDDDDDDDDDDDEYIDLDESAIADFRSKLGGITGSDSEATTSSSTTSTTTTNDSDDTTDSSEISSVDELISFATSSVEQSTDWAKPIDTSDMSSLKGGSILIANPAKFFTDADGGSGQPSTALLAKFGLNLPPPAELGPDRRADLLPVLVLLDRHPLRGCQALLMNRRTGYLMGDLEQQQAQPGDDGDDGDDMMGGSDADTPMPTPKLGAFMIQPLWFGGTSSGGSVSAERGLDMIHQCPTVEGAVRLTEDGLFWGGDAAQAQEAMTDPSLDRVMTGFDFKFFVQSTRWLPLQLENEIRDETWFVASVSKEVLFKGRDRNGARRAKPLWTDIMELMGDEYKDIRDDLYEE